MCKKSLFTVCVVLVLGMVNGVAVGYPDQNDYSIVTGEPVIDGIISGGEWDYAGWFDIDKVYSPSAPDLSEARWAAMWSPGTNLIYVVITGTDTDHNFNSAYVDWNAQDDVEIHIDAGNTDVTDADRAYYRDTMRYAQHYFIGSDGIGGEWSYILDRVADSAIPGGYAANVGGDVITYEFALTPYTDLNLDNPAGSVVKTLAIGDVVGLDMIMCTKSSSSFGMLCENTQMGKWKDASTFLDHTLVGLRLAAYNESPTDGQTNVEPDVVLSWDAGQSAAFHDVYFGTDYNDVNDADTSDSAGIYRSRQGLDANSYDTNDYAADGLFPGRTYYWRIDEVNDADPCSPWKGPVWNFTVECDMVVASPIDWDDLAVFVQQWLVEGQTYAGQNCCGADLDDNGRVDFLDFALLGERWLRPDSGLGNTFYVDPVTGSMSNDGSYSHPWSTLQSVFGNNKIETRDRLGNIKNAGAPVKAGDTILLRSGYHGDINESVYFNDDVITIAAEAGHTPELRRFRLSGGKNWLIRGLAISPSLAPSFSRVTMVDFYSRTSSHGICSNITVEDCFLYTVLDSSGWSVSDWNTKACNGILLGMDGGAGLIVRNNHLLNVNFAIMLQAQGAIAEYNTIENFSGDGIRTTFHDVIARYNLIKNCYNVNDNHDDGIQSYLVNVGPGAVYRVNIIGNIIINTSDPSQPHQGTLQGMMLGDGPCYDFVVENNVIMTNHYIGIMLENSQNGRIVNNTVFNKWYYGGVSGFYTWILVTAGPTNGGNLVRNNIAHKFLTHYPESNPTNSDPNAIVDHNLTISQSDNADLWFVDYANFDMRTLAASSPQVDAGSADLAPTVDIVGVARPQGEGFDIGAYEYQP